MTYVAERNGGPATAARGPVGVVALAQLLGTSLWFSANGAADDLARSWHATSTDIGWLTGAVQLGFILGTLFLSLSGLADRFAASRIFAACAVAGALLNGAFAWLARDVTSGAALRCLVGISLAGIYPLGMKLIVSWNPQRAGASLALLVGMLTLGTALPHALRALGVGWPWQYVVGTSSLLALVAAAMVFLLGDGPHLAAGRSKPAFRMANALAALRSADFRSASLGYLGHMWELYAFWTLVPLLVLRTGLASGGPLPVAGMSFFIVAAGTVGCLAGGVLSRRWGSPATAAVALAVSGLCCLCFPWIARSAGQAPLLAFMLLWGATVVADSPQFSAMASASCPPQAVGSALALLNSAGFAVTVVAIAAATSLADALDLRVSWLLLPGPVLGLIGMSPLLRKAQAC